MGRRCSAIQKFENNWETKQPPQLGLR